MQTNKKKLKFWKIAFFDIFTISKITLRGRMLVQNYFIFYYFISTYIWPDQCKKTKFKNISFKWLNIIIEWEWRKNHILANIFSTNRVGVQKMSNSQPAPISGNVINQILDLETHGNNSRHVDKCCTDGLGNSLDMAPCWCQFLYCIFT